MYIILSALARLIAPIIPFTADEIWKYIPHSASDNTESVFLNDMPNVTGVEVTPEFEEKWNRISALRDDVKKALELKRAEKVIGSSLEACVTLNPADNFFDGSEKLLETVFIVSKVVIDSSAETEFKGEATGVGISVTRAEGEKCERCWTYSDTVGKCADHPTLCERCARTV